MKNAFRFLVLDDDEDAAFLNRHALERAFPGCTVVAAATCESALAELGRQTFDALLADHHLQGTSGSACIVKIRGMGVTCPILMVTGSEDPKIHAEAYAAGATAVCSPDQPDFVKYLKGTLPGSERSAGE